MSTFLARYRTTLVAAALNLSGTGAGYLFLRAWWLAAGHWLGLLIWWFVAQSETGWLVALLVWVGLSVVAAALGGLRVDSSLISVPVRRGPAVVASVTAVVLLAGVLVGAGAYRGAAADSFRGAVTAHTDGRCAQALDRLEDMKGVFRRGFAADPQEVDAEIDACAALEGSRAQAGADDEEELAQAVEAYDAYLASPVARFAGAADEQAAAQLDRADALADGGEPGPAFLELTAVYESGLETAQEVPARLEAIFTRSLAQDEGSPCLTVHTLDWYAEKADVSFAEDVAATATGRLPAELYDCAQDRFADARADAKAEPREYDADLFAAARDTARRITAEFPRSKQAPAARALAERITEAEATARERARRMAIIDDIKATEGGKLPPPTASGSSGSGSSLVVVENGTSEQLEVLWTGPTTGKVRIPRGTGGRCLSGTGPAKSITLGPGRYTMVVRAVTDSGVIPYKGSWNMSAGTRYDECYYIDTQFGF